MIVMKETKVQFTTFLFSDKVESIFEMYFASWSYWKELFLDSGVFRYVLQSRSGVRGPLCPIIIASQQRFSFPASIAGRLPFIWLWPPERASVSEVFPPSATVLQPGTWS